MEQPRLASPTMRRGELGDVVYIELPKVGAKYSKHDVFGTIEAVKAVSGAVLASLLRSHTRERATRQEPALVNTDPFGEGWMIRVRLTRQGRGRPAAFARGLREAVG
jgi:glycine cleavage system H protein